MVIGCAFIINVKPFECVEVSTFLMVIQLHCVVDRIRGMCVFVEMLCRSGRVAISLERVLAFIVSHFEISVQHRLSYSPGMLICTLRTRRICHVSGSYVLGGYVWCYECGILFSGLKV